MTLSCMAGRPRGSHLARSNPDLLVLAASEEARQRLMDAGVARGQIVVYPDDFKQPWRAESDQPTRELPGLVVDEALGEQSSASRPASHGAIERRHAQRRESE